MNEPTHEEQLTAARRVADFMYQRARQIEADCLERGDNETDYVYGLAVRMIEVYENEYGEQERDNTV